MDQRRKQIKILYSKVYVYFMLTIISKNFMNHTMGYIIMTPNFVDQMQYTINCLVETAHNDNYDLFYFGDF